MITGARGLSLGLLACSGCGLLIEDSPRFSADAGSADSGWMDTGSTDTGATPADMPSDPEGILDGEPPRPSWLIVDELGNPDDANVVAQGPALLLAGGGASVDAAYDWQADRIAGGDIVVLQSSLDSGNPTLTNYLYYTIGRADSVQTIIVPPGVASWEPWIAWTVRHAEAVLIVGDDPYGLLWKHTPLAAAITQAWERGAVIGGVDAGLSVLGELVFPGHAGPENWATSVEALGDPYVSGLMLESGYLRFEPLADALIEPRFANEDRMGRLLALAARVLEDGWSTSVVGIGVDADTAMVIDANRVGTVHGTGHVYVVRTEQPADVCAPGQNLEFGPLLYYTLAAGDTVSWPGGVTTLAGEQLIATAGATVPAIPY